MEIPEPTCPRAKRIAGATDADAGCVCGVMERDQERADPLLEGAPVGVLIRVRDDPSTYFNLCAGQGEPLVDPDELPTRAPGLGHYTGCPIFCAEREWRDAQRRMFAPRERPAVEASSAAGSVAPEGLTREEAAWLTGERVL